MLFTAFDLGITHFDLANNYGPPPGSAEEFFGTVMQVGLQALPRRDDHFVQGRLGHVARPLWRWRQPQISAGQPRPEPEADEARLCRHLLFAPLRSQHAARGDDGCARHGRAPGQGALCRHLVLLATRRRRRPPPSSSGSARPRSSTSRATPCSTAGPSATSCSTGWRPRAWAASSFRRWRRACSPTATSTASRPTAAPPAGAS